MVKLVGAVLCCLISFNSAARQVQDIRSVPIDIDLTSTISAQSTCGVESVDSLDFNNIPPGENSALHQITFDIFVNCVAGSYKLYFDGGSDFYDIGDGAGIWISPTFVSYHIHSGLTFNFSGTNTSQRLTFRARLVDATDVSITPNDSVAWSGNVPFTLASP